jgi:inhibitor of cysteine peptidase
MLKVLRIIVMFGLLPTALSACGASNEVKLDAGDDGSQVELNAGQTLVVSLEGNPTTGYTWEAAELDEQVFQQVGETEFKPESGAIGAGGVQTLRFETVNSGQTTLNLVYHRPWEENVEPAETFSIQVVVR